MVTRLREKNFQVDEFEHRYVPNDPEFLSEMDEDENVTHVYTMPRLIEMKDEYNNCE